MPPPAPALPRAPGAGQSTEAAKPSGLPKRCAVMLTDCSCRNGSSSMRPARSPGRRTPRCRGGPPRRGRARQPGRRAGARAAGGARRAGRERWRRPRGRRRHRSCGSPQRPRPEAHRPTERRTDAPARRAAAVTRTISTIGTPASARIVGLGRQVAEHVPLAGQARAVAQGAELLGPGCGIRGDRVGEPRLRRRLEQRRRPPRREHPRARRTRQNPGAAASRTVSASVQRPRPAR